MRRQLIFTVMVCLLAVGGTCVVCAQSPQFSIFDSFEQRSKPGEGDVVIHQSEAIKKLVGTRVDNENVEILNGKPILNLAGYRIQVYSSNIQRVAKGEAEALAAKIKELFPDLETYPKYFAPFWKLHVGNYLTDEEASIMWRELRKAFPQRKNEIFIIEDKIQLPLD